MKQSNDVFNNRQALRNSTALVFADHRWPLKIGIGGLLMLTLLGFVLPQGFIIEHLDNSRRGYRTPLPFWRLWGDKAIMGLLAFIFDAVYFGAPLVVAGLLTLCAAPLATLRQGQSVNWVLLIFGVVAAGLWLVSFCLSLSPLAKVSFSREGDLEQGFGRRVFQRALDPLNRRLYFNIRLATVPLYLPAALVAVGWGFAIRQSGTSMWLILLLSWLLCCTLFWAWLIVAQMYLDIAQLAEERQIDAMLEARRVAFQQEREQKGA